MDKIYFITERFLRDYSGFTNNINIQKISYLIKINYEITIVDLLGSYFSNYLLNKHQDVLNNIDTYTTEEEELVDIIQYIIAFGVNYDSVSELSFTMYNKGVQVQDGDFSKNADFGMIKRKQDNYKNIMNNYILKLDKYLKNNKENFPEFIDKLNDDSKLKDKCSSEDFNDFGFSVI